MVSPVKSSSSASLVVILIWSIWPSPSASIVSRAVMTGVVVAATFKANSEVSP